MHVEVVKSEPEVEKREYPRFFEFIENNSSCKGMIVMFLGRCCGVVLVEKEDYVKGQYHSNFLDHSKDYKWKELPPGTKITITT